MWEWYRERYMGAAHGVVGIIFMLLHVPELLEADWWTWRRVCECGTTNFYSYEGYMSVCLRGTPRASG